ncbi:PAS domain S-box protein [Mesorhizobium sp. KR1-2]|uniref:PAS domain S-box protein n=1 Tax=Mesorhizobium sp. KR1-2 TaxID=3156609 RepID=UPI0032B58895
MIKGAKRLTRGKNTSHPSSRPEAQLDRATRNLAAIVENSNDAILTQDLEGTITSWNAGAQQLFGYAADEAIGKSVTMLMSAAQHDGELSMLARIRGGERVNHYETIRRRKDGTLIHVSLTVSPVKGANGEIVGASRIVRDITERVKAQEQQRLLLREMEHRIKNVFALASSFVGLSAHRAATPAQLAEMVRERLGALARAHALSVPSMDEMYGAVGQRTTLLMLVRTILSPCLERADNARVSVAGHDLALSSHAVTPLALVVNELMTNATKHGALHEPSGRVVVESAEQDGHIVLVWTERGGNTIDAPPEHFGFGTRLCQITVEKQLGGRIEWDWRQEGLTVTLTFDPARLASK